MSEIDDAVHLRENRRYWNSVAHDWVEKGEEKWREDAPHWGIWQIPQEELPLLPEELRGLDAIELGCGTGYVSAWMARRGATCTAIDLSEEQLATAQRLAEEHEVPLTLLHGNAEEVPRADASFDFAISEYGAATWCDPRKWIPEAHRLLRPGGTLHFLCCSPWQGVCTPEDGTELVERFVRPYFGLRELDYRELENDPGGYEWQLPISAWFQLFRETGFEVLDFLEPQPPADTSRSSFYVPTDWARRFPAEIAWKLRKR
jgi:SAM-dependent methyltransferase